jgi:hypothetical protein
MEGEAQQTTIFERPRIVVTRGCSDAAVSGIKIEYIEVPIWPILGLRERLGNALGQEILGAFNPDEIDTWEKDPEWPGAQNRRREVFVNSSFEDEPEEVASKKHGVKKSTQVGVVV